MKEFCKKLYMTAPTRSLSSTDTFFSKINPCSLMQNTEQNLQVLNWQQSQFWPHSLYHMPGLELRGWRNSASYKGFCISPCCRFLDNFFSSCGGKDSSYTQLQSGEWLCFQRETEKNTLFIRKQKYSFSVVGQQDAIWKVHTANPYFWISFIPS